LQSLYGYDATHSGVVLAPAGIGAIATLIVVARLLGAGMDARYLMATGLVVMGLGSWMMSRFTLDISPWPVVIARIIFIAGLSMIFAPLNVAAFARIPPQLRGAAVGLLALLRNEGGSVGTSAAQTLHERREQFHSLRLGENLDPFNPALNDFIAQSQSGFNAVSGDPVAANQSALAALANLRQQQADALAYFDVFFVFAMLAFALVILVMLMKSAAAPKGAHIAAE
jgi:DHA2 family multidrug resistance protein